MSENLIIADLRDLREEMRTGFHSVNDRLDKSLLRCSDECVNVFASKESVQDMRGWIRNVAIAVLALLGLICVIHGETALTAIERVLKVI